MSVPAGSRPHGEVLPAPSLKALRAMHTGGFSRRTLLRRALGAGVGLVALGDPGIIPPRVEGGCT